MSSENDLLSYIKVIVYSFSMCLSSAFISINSAGHQVPEIKNNINHERGLKKEMTDCFFCQ